MPSVNLKPTSPTAFGRWVERHGFSIAEAALAIGCAKNSVQQWKHKEPPRYILLACAAFSEGVSPVR